jgi:hypothetical protein
MGGPDQLKSASADVTGSQVGHVKRAKFRHSGDQRNLDAPDLGALKLSARDRASDLKGNCVGSGPSDLSCQSFNLFGVYGACGDAGREIMSVGIPARPSLAGARAWSCALSRISPVHGNLSFRCHGQDAWICCRFFFGIRLTGV